MRIRMRMSAARGPRAVQVQLQVRAMHAHGGCGGRRSRTRGTPTAYLNVVRRSWHARPHSHSIDPERDFSQQFNSPSSAPHI
eukprot:5674870-Prymnesium_polylepis.1